MDWECKQLCVITRDMQRVMQNFIDILGIGPWEIRHFTQGNVRNFKINGALVNEPFEFVTAAAQNAGMEYEIAMPVSGPNIYWDYLDKYGEGFHHYKARFSNDELPRVIEHFKMIGMEPIQSGQLGEDLHYYFDTRERVGFMLEIGNCSGILPPDSYYPPRQNST